MKKNEETLNRRKEFVITAINDPATAAKQIKEAANKIKKSKNTNETLQIISDLCFLTPRTLENDLYS
jgi:hypothetical protein